MTVEEYEASIQRGEGVSYEGSGADVQESEYCLRSEYDELVQAFEELCERVARLESGIDMGE